MDFACTGEPRCAGRLGDRENESLARQKNPCRTRISLLAELQTINESPSSCWRRETIATWTLHPGLTSTFGFGCQRFGRAGGSLDKSIEFADELAPGMGSQAEILQNWPKGRRNAAGFVAANLPAGPIEQLQIMG